MSEPQKPTAPTPPERENLLPEAKRELSVLWRNNLLLAQGGARKKVEKVLGKQGSVELYDKHKGSELEKIQHIYDVIVDTRTGMYPYIQPKTPQDALAKKVPYTLDEKVPVTNKLLSDLVEDPDSREAQVLAWLFETFMDPSKPEQVKQYSEIFGDSKIQAYVVLDLFLKKRFETRLGGLAEDKKREFYSQITEELTSKKKSSEYNNEVQPGAIAKTITDVGNVIADFPKNSVEGAKRVVTGTSTPVKIVSAPLWAPIRGTKRAITGAFKGFMPSKWNDLHGVEKVTAYPGKTLTKLTRWLSSPIGGGSSSHH